jgi:hypothetical protein
MIEQQQQQQSLNHPPIPSRTHSNTMTGGVSHDAI